jgi:DNA invertase Pin-like site-specific DNA recombinase
MKVALYARVSRADKDQNPENQLIRLRNFAQSHEWEIFQEYVDHASGSQASRPALDRMLTDARAHRFNAVVVVRLDRIGRSVRNLHNLLLELNRFKVDLICTDQEIDTSSPAGKLIFTILGAISEFELELIRDRTKDGLARAIAQGKRLGRPPNPAKTEEILRLRAEGLSLREIGRRLGISHQGVKQRLRRHRLQNRVSKST